MKLQVRPTQVREHLNIFIYAHPGGGKTYFALTSYDESKRQGPVIFDADKGGVDDTALDMGLVGKIPIVPMGEDEAEKMFYAVMYPEEIVEMVHSTPGFEDYEVTTFVFDTISSGLELLLGNSAFSLSPDDPSKEIPASGLMKAKRARKEGMPAQGDYKANHNRARLWFRKARDLPYHTIITCHAGIEEDQGQVTKERDSDKTYAGYPILPGKLRYDAAKLVDHFFFMEQTVSGQFVTHTRPAIIGGLRYNARTRIRRYLKEPEVDLTFPKLKAIYDRARKEGEVEDA